MSRLSAAFEPCAFIEKTRQPDGLGGYKTTYTEGAEFEAAISFNNTLEARTAQKQGVKSLYTVTTTRGVGLEYHEIIKRISDGKLFRITSNAADNHTPASASFSIEQTSAEEWTLE